MCPSLCCSWPRRGLGVRGRGRGAEVGGAKALERPLCERDEAPAWEEVPEGQWPERPSGPATSSLSDHTQARREPSNCSGPVSRVPPASPAPWGHTLHKGPPVPQPPTAEAGERARPPTMQKRGDLFPNALNTSFSRSVDHTQYPLVAFKRHRQRAESSNVRFRQPALFYTSRKLELC